MKCVMIIDPALPKGVQVNTAAALGISLASEINGLCGEEVIDADGRVHRGITNIPIPILEVEKDKLKAMYDELMADDDEELVVIGFSDVAQRSQRYELYKDRIAVTEGKDIGYLGICIYGPDKRVKSISGSLRMLR